jgi:multidrug efflux pump subunit AcrA (membrane-fusion protein)
VVDDKDTAQQKYVTLGPVIDGLRVIKTGLAAGDRVIVNGMAKVRPGAKVKPKTEGAPAKPATSAAVKTD